MALLDRVAALIRANIRELVERAEQPETMMKQLLLDMQNQFMQVKTQVAMAIADRHRLEQKQNENLALQQEWVRKAQVALDKGEDELARRALERSLSYEAAARGFGEQVEDQTHQVALLRDALQKLEEKMTETKSRAELLLAQHRRSRLAARMGNGTGADFEPGTTFDRMRAKVEDQEAEAQAKTESNGSNPAERIAELERLDRVERLLAELKAERLRI
ncbi:MAG TPA: PspA/IM30 family protein [Bryobacteraceae bacterium]|jgi:phage shock protein A|nr:PspA/IM30 family protein [Bryobacteraceae bacterium]